MPGASTVNCARLDRVSFDSRELEALFDSCFRESENTCLRGGAEEPVYLPADDVHRSHRLFYREDYFASGLHEIAHWCLAGKQRRQQVDFGYWYAPEGRDPEQQRAFEKVEVKPQALEWFFAKACGFPFQVSLDNFDAQGRQPEGSDFKECVVLQAKRWQDSGFPVRAQRFFEELALHYGVAQLPHELNFDLLELEA